MHADAASRVEVVQQRLFLSDRISGATTSSKKGRAPECDACERACQCTREHLQRRRAAVLSNARAPRHVVVHFGEPAVLWLSTRLETPVAISDERRSKPPFVNKPQLLIGYPFYDDSKQTEIITTKPGISCPEEFFRVYLTWKMRLLALSSGH